VCRTLCWVDVIFFACVCEGALGSTIVSDDPSRSVSCVVCIGRFPRGVPRGAQVFPPPGYAQHSAMGGSPGPTGFGAAPQKKNLAAFTIF
jgi:hypothetical protein